MFRSYFFYISIILISGSFASCFRNPSADSYAEFKSLMENQWSATGSTLTYQTCGWPVYGGMKLKNIKVSLFPDSDLNDGRGYADLITEGENFRCGGKLFFIYRYSYTGGHGYSGGTELAIGIITRESPVDEKISDPESAVVIMTGSTVSGELTESDKRLPDGSYADFYAIELKDEKPAIKFTDMKGEGFNIHGSVYQQKMLLSPLTKFGVKLKPGRAIILITAGNQTGRYSFRIEDLNEAEKSNPR